MASNKGNEKKTVKPLTSVHVIHYTCSNCGEEEEVAKLCSSCKAPMRVIQVVELYGDEANEYLENLKKNSQPKEEGNNSNIQYDDSVLGADKYPEEKEGDGLEDDVPLVDIFPEDDDEKKKDYVGEVDDDFESALDILDQEEDDGDIDDLPEL